MSGKRSKWAALVFLLVALAAVERGEANQSWLNRTTFNSATSSVTHVDFDSSVHVQHSPHNNPGSPDYDDTSTSRPPVGSAQFVDVGSLPGSLALLLAGLIGLMLVRYRS